MDAPTVEDLFVVGIGFDIAGAFLLGRGLLVTTTDVARLASTFVGWSAPLAVRRTEDRVDGAAGLCFLVLGFALQAAAYGVTLSRETPAPQVLAAP